MDYKQAATDSFNLAYDARAQMDGYFPLPDALGCLRYALTELGEHERANLHAERPLDKRRRLELDHGADKEWGDVGFMIASAGIASGVEVSWRCEIGLLKKRIGTWDFVYKLSELGWYAEHNGGVIDDSPLDEAMAMWAAYAIERGWNPVELMRNTCDKLIERWCPLDPGVKVEPLGDEDGAA